MNDFTPDDLLNAMIECANNTYANPANSHSGNRAHQTKAEYRIHSAQYRKRHPERIRARTANYRVNTSNSSENAKAIREMYEFMEGRCGYCGISVFWDIAQDVQIDHIVPLALGGTNRPANLIIACKHCNARKNNKTFEQWRIDRGW